jgi:hypothetical protein
MMQLLTSLEGSEFATWLRESPSVWAYPTVLTLHTLGLGILVGANWALDLRVLGFARAIPMASLVSSFRAMWIGFWINTLSGVLLFAADATTKGTTTVFVWKLGIIAAGVVALVLLKQRVYGSADPETIGFSAKLLAGASLVLWVAAIGAGRLMAYL